MHDDELDPADPSAPVRSSAHSLQEWLRAEFPVRAVAGFDYRALRAENARRHERATLIRGRETC